MSLGQVSGYLFSPGSKDEVDARTFLFDDSTKNCPDGVKTPTDPATGKTCIPAIPPLDPVTHQPIDTLLIAGTPDYAQAYAESRLPAWLQAVTHALPLTHSVALARPLMNGEIPAGAAAHVMVLIAYAIVAIYVALVLARRRLLK